MTLNTFFSLSCASAATIQGAAKQIVALGLATLWRAALN
jgi:hypothetical protein